MLEARRTGRHVYVRDWDLPPEGAHHADSIIEWCRHVLGQCRRPWGIDGFDLAVAVRTDEEKVVSHRFLRMRPKDLYGEDMPRQLASLFLPRLADGRGPRRVAAALFSWGDAAHSALPPSM